MNLTSKPNFEPHLSPNGAKNNGDIGRYTLPKRKSGLDLASCNLITVENKDLANELYHRLKAREETFASLCNTFTPKTMEFVVHIINFSP